MNRKTVLLGMAFILGMGMEKSFANPAPILLTIDDSDPSAVTITATGLHPMVDDTGKSSLQGVDLMGFFSENKVFNSSAPNSTLTGGDLTLSYNHVGSDGANNLDLNLYVDSAEDPQNFFTSQSAFTGSWTIDFSAMGVSPSALPAIGTSGSIISGFSLSPGSDIGRWQVASIPEPSTGSFLLLGSAVGFVFWHRRTRKNAAERA